MNTVVNTEIASWHLARKIAFRFLFVYLVLYCLFPAGFLPFWVTLVNWVAHTFLGVTDVLYAVPTGSGDTTIDFVTVFIYLIFSMVVTVLWSVADRRRKHYARLWAIFFIMLRHYLGFFMLTYGLAKVFPVQFGELSLMRLLQTYGESSPMGLLWTFMAASPAYGMFTGFGEVLAGLLLLFRRTALAGACVVVAIMANVVMLNFCYDVPVKLFSSHLLLIAFIIIAPDFTRVLSFFTNRAVPAGDSFPLFTTPLLRKLRIIMKCVVCAAVVAGVVTYEYLYVNKKPAASPLYGFYDTDVFVHNTDTLAPWDADDVRWKNLIIDDAESFTINYMDNSAVRGVIDADTAKHLLRVMTRDSLVLFTLRYDALEPGYFVFHGKDHKDSVHVAMYRKRETDFLLTSRGFNWVNEQPFNQ